MSLELTRDQAAVYLGDLLVVLEGLSLTLAAAVQLAEHTPDGRLPQGMLSSLGGSWESLDSRFQEVYAAVYGSHTTDTVKADESAGP